MQFANRRFLLLLVTGAILFTGSLWAQDKAADGQDKKDAKDASTQQQDQDPLKRPLTEKQKKAQAKALRQELSK